MLSFHGSNEGEQLWKAWRECELECLMNQGLLNRVMDSGGIWPGRSDKKQSLGWLFFSLQWEDKEQCLESSEENDGLLRLVDKNS